MCFTYRYVLKDDSEVVSEDGPERELCFVAAGKARPSAIVVDDGYFKVECRSFLRSLRVLRHYLQVNFDSKMS